MELHRNFAPTLDYFLSICSCYNLLCKGAQLLLTSAGITKIGENGSFLVQAINFASITERGCRECRQTIHCWMPNMSLV